MFGLELLFLFGFIVLGAVYFTPIFIAGSRQHPQRIPIALINILAGWTFVGWIAALVWASSHFERPKSE